MEFEDLMLKIRVQSLVQGKLVGLSGRLLIVRDAGEDAWLGLPAPEEEDPPLALPSTSTHSPTIDSVGDSSPALKVCRERYAPVICSAVLFKHQLALVLFII